MAQNFRNYLTRETGTSAVDALGGAANSFDTLISVRMANVTTSTITVEAYIRRSSANPRWQAIDMDSGCNVMARRNFVQKPRVLGIHQILRNQRETFLKSYSDNIPSSDLKTKS